VGYHAGDVDYNAIGKQGGLKQVTLTEQQIPSHTHTGSTNSAGAHTHGIDLNINAAGDGIPALERGNSVQNQNFNTKSAGAHTHTITLNNTGGGQAHENRPPYYTLAYIIYVG